MGFLTEMAKGFAKGYVQERGISGTLEDAGNLIQGAAKMGGVIFGGSHDVSDDDEYDEEDYSQNFFDEETWKALCEKLNASKADGDYEGARRILNSYYNRYDVKCDYWYQNWEADIKIAQFRDVGERPVSEDLKLKIEISNMILSLTGREDESKEATKELNEMFDEAKSYVSFARDFNSFSDKIEELREPEHVQCGSKIKDIEKAFSLLDEFYNKNKRHNELEGWFVPYFKVQIYNALFAALAKRPQELKSLTDSQLSGYFADAEDNVVKALENCADEEDKSKEEFFYVRIPEQIEELKQLRMGKSSSSVSSAKSHSEVDDNEQEYLDEVKACLEDDGQITDRERRLLDRLRKSLGISEKRAKELEASVSSLSDDEKEYLEELRACMQDGNISDRERRLLDRLRKSLGISESRAKELEKSL